MSCNRQLQAITQRIVERSKPTRSVYLERVERAINEDTNRSTLTCGNLAHGFAACSADDKFALGHSNKSNLGIITSYNDMLSAHQPFEAFPALIKQAAKDAGGVAQVAGGVPAMCDGVTQGQPGMELSLFSRDVIAMAAAVGLSHNMFDGALYLGVCDKIIPGLAIAALTFGHIPAVFIPAGPMTSGISNDEKAQTRNLYAQGKISREELLESESKSYHGPGTCTFYGTANSNQMVMEIMGLHTPGSSFINPGTPLRDALTYEATQRALAICKSGDEFTPVGKMIDEKSFVNGIVGLNTTGGSTNHTLHLLAMAQAAGIALTWQDISDISEITPLLARVYPNGKGDVNHFHAAGGLGFVIQELLDFGLLHDDVQTVWGQGLRSYCVEAKLNEAGKIERIDVPKTSADSSILAPAHKAFQPTGGLVVLNGNLGKAIIKVSAVDKKYHCVEAPALVFHSQKELQDAFKAGDLDRDFIAVVRFQGPQANGMPELHKLTPCLSVLQAKGFKVALVTDGRMSGASGKVPAAIHVTPEACDGGIIGKIQDGDIIRLDARAKTLSVLVEDSEMNARQVATADLDANQYGMGRELFKMFRQNVNTGDKGASVF